jgi:hypothetical protein
VLNRFGDTAISEILERMHVIAGGSKIDGKFYPSPCKDDAWACEVSRVASRLENLANGYETGRSGFFGGPLTDREIYIIKHFA